MSDEITPNSVIAVSDAEDLSQEITGLRKKAKRHLQWSLLGVSPAALLPALGLMGEGSTTFLILLVVLVTLTQGYLWHRARHEADQLENRLREALHE